VVATAYKPVAEAIEVNVQEHPNRVGAFKGGGRKMRQRATRIAAMAKEHPAYAWIAIGLVAFGLGFFLRGSHQPNNTNKSGSSPDASLE
jgi:hypothetical protein